MSDQCQSSVRAGTDPLAAEPIESSRDPRSRARTGAARTNELRIPLFMCGLVFARGPVASRPATSASGGAWADQGSSGDRGPKPDPDVSRGADRGPSDQTGIVASSESGRPSSPRNAQCPVGTPKTVNGEGSPSVGDNPAAPRSLLRGSSGKSGTRDRGGTTGLSDATARTVDRGQKSAGPDGGHRRARLWLPACCG